METLDLSGVRIETGNEIDNAIYAVLCAAFAEEDDAALRALVRLRLPDQPTPQQIVDAVCDELRWRGRLRFEEQRRLQATHVLAAFLDLPRSERQDLSLMPAG